tara:strand:- start:45 stop:692 length:648 start_codon:yes stop_codon:yes gene_type:complete
MNQPEIVSLFPENVAIFRTNVRDILEEMKQEEWVKIKTEDQVGTASSLTKDLYILDRYPDIKEMIMDHFNLYKNEYLRYTGNEFAITTSWGTKTTLGAQSTFHDHKNCMFSGVFYVTDTPKEGDPASLIFKKKNDISFWCLPDRQNQFNSDTWFFVPPYQSLIFFPSHLQHKIGLQRVDRDRIAIAFNIIPVGIIGNDDSHVQLSVQRVEIDDVN